MKKWSIFTLLLMLVTLVCLMAGCNSAPAPQTAASDQRKAIRIATDYRVDSIGYQQLQDFAIRVQEKSKNTIVVKLYDRGSWSETESFDDYVTLGTLEMAAMPIETVSQLQPAYAVYNQPYLFSSMKLAENYITGKAGRSALDTLPEAYYGIGFVPDGYLYLLNQGGLQWISYGDLRQLGQTKALGGAAVYDLRALYCVQPLVASRTWWDGLNDQQRNWIQESFQEAVAASFIQQTDKDPAQSLLSAGVVFQNNAAPEWSTYSAMYLQQRETYFAEHSDSLTVYWRPVIVEPPITGEEEPAQ